MAVKLKTMLPILLLQAGDAKPIDWVTVILVITNVLGPIVTFLATRRQYAANVDDSTTKTAFLKLDKAVTLMDKIEAAQDKYLKLRDQHSRTEQRMRQMEATYSDFWGDVSEVLDLVEEFCNGSKQHTGLLSRIARLRVAGVELEKLKLTVHETQEPHSELYG